MRIALNLESFHDLLKSDLSGTLSQIFSSGFRNVEVTSVLGESDQALGEALSEAGLKAVSFHVQLHHLRSHCQGNLATAELLGAEWLVIPIVQLDEYASGWKRLGAELAGMGREIGLAGRRLAFHPNMAEFRPDGDQTGLENLFQGSDQELEIEFDVALASKSKVDSTEWLRKLTNKVPLILVDMEKGEPNTEHPGYVDWQKLKPVAKSSGVMWVVVKEGMWTGDRFEQLATLHQLFRSDGLLD